MLPLVCVLLTVLLVAGALAIDIGRLQAAGVEVQTAADAAALAAAQAAGRAAPVANREADASAAAVAIGTANLAAGAAALVTAADVVARQVDPTTGAVTTSTWADATGVEVTARAAPTYVLAGMAGLAAPTITRRATARIAGSLDGMGCLLPMVLPYAGTYNRLFGTNLSSAPDMTPAQMATVTAMSPKPRSAVFLPPGEPQTNRQDDGNWSAVDYTGGSGTVAAYADWVKAINCTSAKAKLKNTPAMVHKAGTATQFITATTEALNSVCNFDPGDATDARCFPTAARTSPGVAVRATFADVAGTAPGSAVAVRALTSVRVMCYFRTPNDKCRGVTLPEGAWEAPYKFNNYPAGSLVVLLNSPFPGTLPKTSDMVFGAGNAMTSKVVGHGGKAALAR